MPDQIDQLLEEWHRRRDSNSPAELSELCRLYPELEPELRRRIEFILRPRVVDAPASETSAESSSISLDTTTSNATDEWPGELPTIPGYQILDVLGEGTFGIAFKARDLNVPRLVAIKLLKASAGSSVLARFQAESSALARASHPNIVQIHSVGRCTAGPFIVMEYIPGGTLAGRVRKEKPTPADAAAVVAVAAWAVQAAHNAGVYHRDLKPANILLGTPVEGSNANTPLGFPKVADFGIAKLVDAAHQEEAASCVTGTIPYMAPEQVEPSRGPIGPATDVYGLGAVLYSILAGRPPFNAASPFELFRQILQEAAVPLDQRNASVRNSLAMLCDKCLSKSPNDRFQSASDLAEALASFARGEFKPTQAPIKRRPTRRQAVLAVIPVAVALCLGIGVLLWRPWAIPDSTTGAKTPPVSASEPIRVGVLHSMTGTMSNSETPVIDAARFAIDEVNAAGGVLGRPLEAVVADGGSIDSTFAREAERLLTADQVRVVFGCWTSSSRKTVVPVFEQHDQLLIYPVQFEGLETSPSVVYMGAAPNQQIIPAIRWARSTLGAKRFFLVGSDYVFPRAANAIIKEFLTREGLEVVGEVYLRLGSPETHAAADAIAQTKPDMILNTISGDTNIAFFRALRAAGLTSAVTPTLSFNIDVQGMRSLNSADLAGDYVSAMYFESIESPENKEFVNRFHEKYPLHGISDSMETAYLGVKLWAAAANEAQSTDPKKVRQTLLLQRLAGPGGEVRLDADTQYCYRTPRIGQIQADGHIKVVWTETQSVRPKPFPETRTAEAWRAYLHDLYTGWGNRWAAP